MKKIQILRLYKPHGSILEFMIGEKVEYGDKILTVRSIEDDSINYPGNFFIEFVSGEKTVVGGFPFVYFLK